MNAIRKISMMCLLLTVALAVIAKAQGPGQMPSPEDRLANMASKLNLTDDQKAKIKPILEDEAKQMQSLRDDTSTPRMQKMQKMKSIHDSHSTQINALLTPDQQTKYAEMQKEAMEKMRERREQAPQQ